MKNQYVGDINDYRKYGLLRALQSTGDGSLLVAWMLTPDDGSGDGEFRSYLQAPDRWAQYDHDLYVGLAGLCRSAPQLSVSLIEGSGLLPRYGSPDDLEFLESRKAAPIIDSTFELGEVCQAFRHLIEDESQGKVIITPEGADAESVDERCEPEALSPRKEVMAMTNKQVTLALGALLLLLGLASCSPASNDPTYDRTAAEAQIRENARAWANVAVTGDPSVMETIFADDFVGTSPDGNLYTKQDFINDIRANPLGFVSNEVNDVNVRFFGNVAVAQGYETFTRKDGATGRFVWTDILVWRDGRWVTVAAQDVIAPAIAEPASKGLFNASSIPEGQK